MQDEGFNISPYGAAHALLIGTARNLIKYTSNPTNKTQRWKFVMSNAYRDLV